MCGGGSWDNGLFLSVFKCILIQLRRVQIVSMCVQNCWVNNDMLFTGWKNSVQNVNVSDHLNEDTHTDMKPDNQSTV